MFGSTTGANFRGETSGHLPNGGANGCKSNVRERKRNGREGGVKGGAV